MRKYSNQNCLCFYFFFAQNKKQKIMDSEKLLELMHDYLNQYGEMSSFLQYCEDDCDLDKDEVEEAIEEHFYGA